MHMIEPGKGDTSSPETSPENADHRLRLAAEVLTFQIKLGLDGLRDLLLIPVSIAAGVVGIIRGGPDADLPFRQVINFGRQTEIWINLFGRHRGNTSDALIDPLRDQVLDRVNRGIQRRSRHSPEQAAGPVEPSVEVDAPAGVSDPPVPTESTAPGSAGNRTTVR
jgi:hypothetical protein